MWEEQSMGSQTLEILRQGVWASITGGWFYDPSQDVFSNTAHLYIWMFLLCLPFSIYVYLPPNKAVWYVYCSLVAIAFAFVKFANYYLHHVYDTKECVREFTSANGQKREEEGIELQDLSSKSSNKTVDLANIAFVLSNRTDTDIELQDMSGRTGQNQPSSSLPGFDEVRIIPSTDSLESTELHPLDTVVDCEKKFPGTIDLKVEVHRKNSSESSEAGIATLETNTSERHKEPVSVADSCDQDNVLPGGAGRRHSNFAGSSPNFLPVTAETDIKATGSLELAYVDMNPNQALTSENFFKRVRRFKSAALEVCCPPPTLQAHPNSLEVIGCKNGKNPLPPPSTSLVRNQHLNLCPYYGSEIVYPIAEQSDEHQTSHGPDTDVESVTHVSDSDYEENNQASRSPLLCVKFKKTTDVPYTDDQQTEDGTVEQGVSKSVLDMASTSFISAEFDEGKQSGGNREIGIVRKKNVKKNKRRRTNIKAEEALNCSSLAELDLEWLFENEGNKLTNRKEPLRKDRSGTVSISLEQDVSKVLHETLPVNSGPNLSRKKSLTNSRDLERKTPKSESEKCRACSRSKADVVDAKSKSLKENKVTQTVPIKDSVSLEDLDAIPTSSFKITKSNTPRKGSQKSYLCKNEEASSSGSNNELSTLLPPTAPPLLSALLNSKKDGPSTSSFQDNATPQQSQRPRPRRTRVSRKRSAAKRDNAIATSLSAGYGTHSAKNFNDTSDGAVHCFTDEHGNFVTYTFGDKGTSRTGSTDSLGSSSVSTIVDTMRLSSVDFTADHRTAASASNNYDPVTATDFIAKLDDDPPKNHFRFIRVSNREPTVKTKTYYKVKVLPRILLKVTMDRLKLLALLDRNLTLGETGVSFALGVTVAVLGAVLLHLDLYKDLLAFLFCFVIAGCQYSLLKSVQPDAASPTHGFNRLVAYSRPVYFCLFCAIVLVLHHHALSLPRDFFATFLLFFPFIFSLGLFPQIDTFASYLLEQIDVHLYGGNASCSLVAAAYCVARSTFSVVLLAGLAYSGLSESKTSRHLLFSIFCACLVPACYHLSRCASDPAHVWDLIKTHMWLPDVYGEAVAEKDDVEDRPATKEDYVDPLPAKIKETLNGRLKNDAVTCAVMCVAVFAIHASTVFSVLQPELNTVLWSVVGGLGFVLHYVVPQMRKQLPWVCVARPIFRSHEYTQYQIRQAARIMWFERVYVYLCFFERNILYPLVALSALTGDSPKIARKYGTTLGSFVTVICAMKLLRSSYSDQSSQYLIVSFAALFFNYDYAGLVDVFLIQYFLMSIAYHKVSEFLLKIQFVITYIAPWQITWGSAFHAFAQPFSVPHSAMLFLQAVLSAAFSTPLAPFLGSAIFLTSYVRPVKFWERDYNTRRVDHSNTPLSSHLDRNLGADDNNLNSIFYEHLTRSLQRSLCGDLALGRWGPVDQGDVFVMASDYLNCLVHIVETGNGLTTFQMRGLEFRGTYCQQREVEAITEGVEENDGCCCCDTGHLPNMLSINAAFSQRWLAWEVTSSKYILEGYSISDNSVASMLQVFEFRRVLISYYVKSIIFYTVRSDKLEDWLNSEIISKTLRSIWKPNFVDLDPFFNYKIDEDYDVQHNGMTKAMFLHVHGDWIRYCLEKRGKVVMKQRVILLCFALSLLGRRALGAVSQNVVSSVEFFLYGLHALFKGDFRITCARDEWVFTDMDLLRTVVAPAVRMSLKLHQDHFMSPDEYDVLPALYDAICKHEQELVISHEGDPAWRNAVLSGTPSLLALRHVFDEGNDEYKIIMLNKRYLTFRVIKVNKECVRGLWAGQQQELVYLRNRNPERGSIQNAKQALRNIINSSCDQPIGYPIYVSPLTTSYVETNEQYCSLVGGSVTLKKIRNFILDLFRRIRKRCVEGCSSGASNREEIGMGHEGIYAMNSVTLPSVGGNQPDSMGRRSGMSRTNLGGNRGSFASVGKPTSSTLVSLASLFKERDERAVSQAPDATARTDERLGDAVDGGDKDLIALRVKICDPNLVYDCINLGRRIDVSWPTEYMRCRGGRSYWKDWLPEVGMEGPVVHKWVPCHRDPNKRSHVDRTILLMQIDDKFVPIAESGVQILGPDV
ncbi:pecanex-like protein 1 isoform X2 [Cylas formicarius]|uniref:pecanex-like protein 1 isoform X2 n=1 Tax=Cylas formicarius TaxID=197179 RepID=UPI002958ADA3|nr:pecanex-like protein 1 isoform X2 [Cylas formicarius]